MWPSNIFLFDEVISSCKSHEEYKTCGGIGRCKTIRCKIQQHSELARCGDGQVWYPSGKRSRHILTWRTSLQCWCWNIKFSWKCVSACTFRVIGAHKQGIRLWWCRWKTNRGDIGGVVNIEEMRRIHIQPAQYQRFRFTSNSSINPSPNLLRTIHERMSLLFFGFFFHPKYILNGYPFYFNPPFPTN